jgi:hypothetical protein
METIQETDTALGNAPSDLDASTAAFNRALQAKRKETEARNAANKLHSDLAVSIRQDGGKRPSPQTVELKAKVDEADRALANAENDAIRDTETARQLIVSPTVETIKQPQKEDSGVPHIQMPSSDVPFDPLLHSLQCSDSKPDSSKCVKHTRVFWEREWYYVPIQYENQFSDLCLALVARNPNGSAGASPISSVAGKKNNSQKANAQIQTQLQNIQSALEQ